MAVIGSPDGECSRRAPGGQDDPLSPSGMRRCCARPARSHRHRAHPHPAAGNVRRGHRVRPAERGASAWPPHCSLSSGDRGAGGGRHGDPHGPAMGRASARGGRVLPSVGRSLRNGAGGSGGPGPAPEDDEWARAERALGRGPWQAALGVQGEDRRRGRYRRGECLAVRGCVCARSSETGSAGSRGRDGLCEAAAAGAHA